MLLFVQFFQLETISPLIELFFRFHPGMDVFLQIPDELMMRNKKLQMDLNPLQ